MKKFYALENEGSTASITIYGDITSWPWMESDVSAYLLSKQIDAMEAENIDVYINSYGGEVAEGLAIYNALKRHKAKVTTYCDGFACSAASVVFMAGKERVMGDASLLMIHNAWTFAAGNAAKLRKAADDLDTISQATANAYQSSVTISEEELKNLLDNETWILPQDAVTMGFATKIDTYAKSDVPAASARMSIMNRMKESPAKVDIKIDAIEIANALFEQMQAHQPEAEQPKENKTITFLSAFAARKGEQR